MKIRDLSARRCTDPEDAIRQFAKRRADDGRVVNLPKGSTGTPCIAGYTTGTVLTMFGSDINTYVDEMKKGNNKRAVAVAGCTTVRPGQGVAAIEKLTLEQKAVADIFTVLAFGLLAHVSPEPMIGGSRLVTTYLTEEMAVASCARPCDHLGWPAPNSLAIASPSIASPITTTRPSATV